MAIFALGSDKLDSGRELLDREGAQWNMLMLNVCLRKTCYHLARLRLETNVHAGAGVDGPLERRFLPKQPLTPKTKNKENTNENRNTSKIRDTELV